MYPLPQDSTACLRFSRTPARSMSPKRRY
jgi:hypothetical protein